MKTRICVVLAVLVLPLARGAEPGTFPDRATVETAIGEAAQGTGVASHDLRIELLDDTRFPAMEKAHGSLRFTLDPGQHPGPDGITVLHGTWLHAGRETPVWARARILVRAKTLVAQEDLAPNATVQESNARWTETWLPFPARDTVESSARIYGARLRHAVKRGAPISASWLERPIAVHRGQSVELHVRAGAAHLQLVATALADAHLGEMVALRLTGRDVPGISAKVIAPGRAAIETASHSGEGTHQ